MLRLFFRFLGVPVIIIDKGKSEKKSVIKGKKKVQLKHSVERYFDAFAKAGFDLIPVKGPWIIPSIDAGIIAGKMTENKGELNIGVAPYAKHKLKMWPEENMVRLLELISEKYKSKFWLFGGNEDSERLKAFQTKIAGSFNLVGKHNLDYSSSTIQIMAKLFVKI